MGKYEKIIDKYVGLLIIILLLPFFYLKSLFFRNKKIKKILIIRLAALGETLLALPMIERLRKEYEVDVLVSYKNKKVFEILGWKYIVFSPIIFFKNFLKYDLVIDTEPFSNLSAILGVILGKKQLGFDPLFRAVLYDIKVPYNDKQHVVYTYCDMLKPLGIEYKPKSLVKLPYKPYEFKEKAKCHIGIHTGSSATATYRRWGIEKYSSLIKKLLNNYDAYIYLTGASKDEKEMNRLICDIVKSDRLIDLSKTKMSLSDLISLISSLDLFISNDTGPMHVAACQGTKVIGLFGPNTPVRYGPFPLESKTNEYIYKNLPCSPCVDVHIGVFRECKYNGLCTKLITVDEVYKKAVDLLK